MASIKKRAVIALTAAVWLAGLGSAAALTYDLNRPLKQRPVPATVAEGVATRPSAPVAPLEPLVLYVPTVTIVGEARHSPPAARPHHVKDVSEMHCSGWRDLNMGSGHVQTCD